MGSYRKYCRNRRWGRSHKRLALNCAAKQKEKKKRAARPLFFFKSVFSKGLKLQMTEKENTEESGKNLFPLIFALLALFYSTLTCGRNFVWKNDLALWDDATRNSRQKARGHNNMGLAFAREGMFEEAKGEDERSLGLNPYQAEGRTTLGIVYYVNLRHDEAIEEFKKALKFNPNHANAHNNLAAAYAGLGRLDDAEEELLTALRIEPGHIKAHLHLGIIYKGKKLNEKARGEFEEVIRINPGDTNALAQLESLK